MNEAGNVMARHLQQIWENQKQGEWETIRGTPPSKSNQYIIANNRLIKSKAVKTYEDLFYIQCTKYRGRNIQGYFEAHIKVYYPNQRSDLDGMMKVFFDNLQRVGAIKNDNKLVKVIAEKFLDKENPRIEFKINEI